MITIAILDDEKILANRLAVQINEITNIGINIKVYSDPSVFLKDNISTIPDINFLDIDMPELTGFDVAEQIHKRNNDAIIIFVTSHDELVYSSFRFRPFRFLRKSYIDDELQEALTSALYVTEQEYASKGIIFQTKVGTIKTDLNDIIFIEAFNHTVVLHTNKNDTMECKGTLSEYEKNLEKFSFVRSHKSFLVNLKYIYSVRQTEIVLEDKSVIPLSRYKYKEVLSKFNEYLRRF